MDCVEKYYNAAGQLINYGKSSVFFSKHVVLSNQVSLADGMQVQRVQLCRKYLGLPMDWEPQ